jgi:two-component system, NtrC family, response regulator GlrR
MCAETQTLALSSGAMTVRIDRGLPILRRDPQSGRLQERHYHAQVISGPDAGLEKTFHGSLVIGTHEAAGLRLTDPTVSRFHSELLGRGDGVLVRDLQSSNGTLLGGARIQEVVLERETRLTLGKSVVAISFAESAVKLGELSSWGGLIGGESSSMRKLFAVLSRVARSDSTVLLLGETGTGKDLIARALHAESLRRDKPWIVVDCATLTPDLAMSELFGHVKGAFTGAVSDRQGAFLQANGGTLLLHEVGELTPEVQTQLLRALESGRVRRVGEDTERETDVRIIAATHRDLEKEVRAGSFRSDLYFRISVVPVVVPPLRDRLEDLPALTRHFLQALGRPDFELPEALSTRLAGYGWPGNIRELRNLVERALAGTEADVTLEGLREPATSKAWLQNLPFKEAKDKLVDEFTREYLASLLEKHDGVIARAASASGLTRAYIHRLILKFGLRAVDEPGDP